MLYRTSGRSSAVPRTWLARTSLANRLLARTMLAGIAALGIAATPVLAQAATLVFNADTSDAAPRAAFEAVVAKFKAENPGIDVRFNVYDHESYKQSIRNWLTSAPPDVVLWYTGNRMRQLSGPGLLDDVSDLWTPEMKAQFPAKAVEGVTDHGKQYGVPYSTYQWGIYYRSDILQKNGIAPIANWNDMLGACDKLRGAGIDPIVIGTKDLWPTAGWFDYLDLRTNGFDFHQTLMAGKVAWTDPKVKAVFAHWKELLDKKCFVANHTSLSWQEAQSQLYQGTGAMMLIGNFITESIPAETLPKMAFSDFPAITPGLPRAEEAPVDTVHIPAGAKNKADARKFLQFMMRADVQTMINQTEKQIPENIHSVVLDDRFLRQGQKMLNSAAELTQFLDRDTSEDLATIAMKGFQEFMVRPARLDRILAEIERARQRIYGNVAG